MTKVEDKKLANTFAHQAAISLYNALLFEEQSSINKIMLSIQMDNLSFVKHRLNNITGLMKYYINELDEIFGIKLVPKATEKIKLISKNIEKIDHLSDELSENYQN